MDCICSDCCNFLPEYEYGYNDEGDYRSIVGYSCFYDLDRCYFYCPFFECDFDDFSED